MKDGAEAAGGEAPSLLRIIGRSVAISCICIVSSLSSLLWSVPWLLCFYFPPQPPSPLTHQPAHWGSITHVIPSHPIPSHHCGLGDRRFDTTQELVSLSYFPTIPRAISRPEPQLQGLAAVLSTRAAQSSSSIHFILQAIGS